MASQPTENALSERRESKGLFAPLRLAVFLRELRLGKSRSGRYTTANRQLSRRASSICSARELCDILRRTNLKKRGVTRPNPARV